MLSDLQNYLVCFLSDLIGVSTVQLLIALIKCTDNTDSQANLNTLPISETKIGQKEWKRIIGVNSFNDIASMEMNGIFVPFRLKCFHLARIVFSIRLVATVATLSICKTKLSRAVQSPRILCPIVFLVHFRVLGVFKRELRSPRNTSKKIEYPSLPKLA